MYKNQNKINSVYFKKKKKKKIHLTKYNLFTILFGIIIFLALLNIFSKKHTDKKIFIQKKEDVNILPDKPKEKWKYIKKLENL